MKQLLPQKFHNYIYIFALILLVIGMPLSKFLMSLSQIILFCNWVLEGNIKHKLKLFLKNKPALILCSFVLLHIIGIIYSADIKYAIDDIRIKSPLLVLPLLLCTSNPLDKKTVHWIMRFFVTATILSSGISMFVLFGFTKHQVVDIRDISIFISHIRFALLIAVSICISFYLIFETNKKFEKLIYILTILWLLIFLVIMESLTGLGALAFAILVVSIYKFVTSKKTYLKIIGYSGLLFLMVISVVLLLEIKNYTPETHLPNPNGLELYTANGNLYQHDLNGPLTENGNFTWLYVCDKELRTEWNKRSKLNYDDKDLKENPLRYTLIRFMTSKNLRKDSVGISKLSNNEIQSIERGVANVNNQNISNLKERINETVWEINMYLTTGEVNGHSLTQRFEYWKAAFHIIKKNILIGVGTGDVEIELNKEYDNMQSKLDKEYRLHAHNQFISIALTFGIIGFIWFLITLFYPIFKLKKQRNLLYLAFFSMVLFSFLNEDTLETQAGVTFYAFLNSFLLFVFPE